MQISFGRLSRRNDVKNMKRTVLFSFHEKHGRIGKYAGYEMPLWYKGVISEHMAVRDRVGIFDTSHMGRLLIKGSQAANLLNYISTNNYSQLDVMKAQHAFLCNSRGGVIDDFLAFKLGENEFFLVVNAMNREKDIKWIKENMGSFNVALLDLTEKVPMIAVQGPLSSNALRKIFGDEIVKIKHMWSSWFSFNGVRTLISRTGYTGEDGFELYLLEEEKAFDLWDAIMKAGSEFNIEPCGLAARDTLRLEAGFCLYGNELDEETTPIEAGLKFGVRFDDREFIGKEALLRQVRKGVRKIRVGLRMIERGIPRKGMSILKSGKEIGYVTSGTMSPLLKIGIAMGYVSPEYSRAGERVEISVRGRLAEAEIVKFPFYDKRQYGRKRETNLKA